MPFRIRAPLASLAAILTLLFGCGDSAQRDRARHTATTAPVTLSAQASEKKLDPALCSPEREGFTTEIDNPYFPLPVGAVWYYEGEEDGELVELRITVLDETEVVSGVTTQIVEEYEQIDGELVEVSRNFFAQAEDGTVCYFGEEVDIYEDGQIISHEGAWRADQDSDFAPGIIMPANPVPGMKFQMEVAPGIAEDEGTIVGIGPVETEAGEFQETIRVREFNPLDGDLGFKIYESGLGLIVDGPVELIDYEL